jgi:hypothetical protein
MPAIKQDEIGFGRIIWLGKNLARGQFSSDYHSLEIAEDGIKGDIYKGMWREIASHDVDYIETDGVAKGDPVLNLRQITVVDQSEVQQAGALTGVTIERGMLRENIVVQFTPQSAGQKFSLLPPLSRMVIGDDNPKVLILTEENGPCRTICQPMAVHFGSGSDLADMLRINLTHRRGQMAMVRSGGVKDVRIGDTFTIFPPMT